MATVRVTVSCVLLALVLSACSGIQVETSNPGSPPLTGLETYAWSKRIVAPPEGKRINDDLLAERIRRAIDSRLDQRGKRRVSNADEADVIATIGLGVVEGVETNDPYFAQYVARRYERGVITLSFVNRTTQKLLWRGTASDHIRYSANSVGAINPRWVDTKADRIWHVGTIADGLIGALKE